MRGFIYEEAAWTCMYSYSGNFLSSWQRLLCRKSHVEQLWKSNH